MDRFLLVDFGTTSTKSALLQLDGGRFEHLRRHPALPALPGPAGHHEVPLAAIRERFHDLCAESWAASGGFEGIVLCSEMHGFALLHPRTRESLTQYISWLDGRSLEKVDGRTSFDLVAARLGDRFRALTGMRPRPGFPLINLVHCGRAMDLPPEVEIVSLPGWLCRGETGGPPPEHPTILAGMALYDVSRREIAPELLETARELGGLSPVPGEVADETTAAGYWAGPRGPVPVYAGVGDHQCSVLGAGVVEGTVASVNLGTGSQIAVPAAPGDQAFEHRPYFDGLDLTAVTHIPAGRALGEFVGFLEKVSERAPADAGGDPGPDWWAELAALGPGEVDAATLEVDLAVFEGARGFRAGGGIGAVLEGGLTPGNYLASVLRAFVTQYAEVLDELDPGRRLEEVALGGGIARNLPRLAELLSRASGRRVRGACALDESLLGLRALALRCSGRASTAAQAWRLYGRGCEIVDGGSPCL